jgi:MraZ protein
VDFWVISPEDALSFLHQEPASIMFTGASALSLDAKGRMAVPTRHREVLMAACAGSLVITRNHEGGLLMFPQPAWEQFSAKLLRVPMNQQWMKRLYIGHAQPVEMDATGRVLIAPELREAADISSEIKLLGMVDFFELWEPARHAAKEALDLARAGSANGAEAFKDFVF